MTDDPREVLLAAAKKLAEAVDDLRLPRDPDFMTMYSTQAVPGVVLKQLVRARAAYEAASLAAWRALPPAHDVDPVLEGLVARLVDVWGAYCDRRRTSIGLVHDPVVNDVTGAVGALAIEMNARRERRRGPA